MKRAKRGLKTVQRGDKRMKTVKYRFNPKESLNIREYVWQAETDYDIIDTMETYLGKFGNKLMITLFENTRLSKKELSWVCNKSYESVKKYLQKYSIVKRDERLKQVKDTSDKPVKYFTPEYLRDAINSLLEHDLESWDEHDLRATQKKAGNMILSRSLNILAKSRLDKDEINGLNNLTKSVQQAVDMIRDSRGELNTKDSMEMSLKNKLASAQLEKLDIMKRGNNIAVAIVEEYADVNNITDQELLFLVKDSLMRLGFEPDNIQAVSKDMLALIHKKQGKITDEEYLKLTGKNVTFEDVEIVEE